MYMRIVRSCDENRGLYFHSSYRSSVLASISLAAARLSSMDMPSQRKSVIERRLAGWQRKGLSTVRLIG